MSVEWTRSQALALARATCAECSGSGLNESRRRPDTKPCKCVGRTIFRAVMRRFYDCSLQTAAISRASYDYRHSGARRAMWGRKTEEYMADVVAVARRHLSPAEYQLFRCFYLMRHHWQVCARRVGLNRGLFFHSAYRIEAKLGIIYGELQPYALFPAADYFQGTRGEAPPPPPPTPVRLGMSHAFGEHK